MTAAYIDGAYRCYSLVDGRRRCYLGCSHERPRQAIRHTSPTYVSPLRVSGGAPTPVLSAPLPGPDSLGVPSEPRLGDTDPPSAAAG